jgi:hypothetical protein
VLSQTCLRRVLQPLHAIHANEHALTCDSAVFLAEIHCHGQRGLPAGNRAAVHSATQTGPFRQAPRDASSRRLMQKVSNCLTVLKKGRIAAVLDVVSCKSRLAP